MTADDFVDQMRAFILLAGDEPPSPLVWAIVVKKLHEVRELPDYTVRGDIVEWGHAEQAYQRMKDEGGK